LPTRGGTSCGNLNLLCLLIFGEAESVVEDYRRGASESGLPRLLRSQRISYNHWRMQRP